MSHALTRIGSARSLLLGFLLLPLAAYAAPRTFISIGGSDANTASNCSATDPCRGFTAALTVTDPGGEIIVQNSGGYGPVTINKSVSIIAPDGVYAGISVPTGNGITIATAGVKVVLRGLTIHGLGGAYGVSMTAGDELTVENCHISSFSDSGLHVDAVTKARVLRGVFLNNYNGAWFSGGASAVVEETQLSGGFIGLVASAQASAATRVEVNRSSSSFMTSAGFRAYADSNGNSSMSITHSSANGNGAYGYLAEAFFSGSTVQIEVKDSVSSKNDTGGYAYSGGGTVRAIFSGNLIARNNFGLVASAAGATLTASRNMIGQNGHGLFQNAGALFESAGDNVVQQNTTQFSGTITPISKM